MINEWKSCPSGLVSNREQGLVILQALKARTLPIKFVDQEYLVQDYPIQIKLGLDYKGVEPKLSHVIADVAKVKDGDNADVMNYQDSSYNDDLVDGPTILASVISQLTHTPTDNIYVPLSAPATSNGLMKSDLQIPESIRSTAWVPKPVVWRTALSIPLTVTMMHSDNLFLGQAMQHILGHKLWIMVTPTAKSMKELAYVDRSLGMALPRTLRAIKECDDLLVWDCRNPSTILSPPHCFHAVLTFGLASHSGVSVIDHRWIRECEVVVDWFLEACKNIAEEDVEGWLGLKEELLNESQCLLEWSWERWRDIRGEDYSRTLASTARIIKKLDSVYSRKSFISYGR